MGIFSDFSEFGAAVGTEIGTSGVKSLRIVSTALRTRPATSNGSISTGTGQKMNCRAARPSLTDFFHLALRRCSYARGQRPACVAELIALHYR
jgi:hypothetical protein